LPVFLRRCRPQSSLSCATLSLLSSFSLLGMVTDKSSPSGHCELCAPLSVFCSAIQ
jgi:hypothetical protein